MSYWHMQMHPNDKSFADEHIYSILEHKKIIGIGSWEKGLEVIERFKKEMNVNDIVAIKNGAKLIALVQIIGGWYEVKKDNSEIKWIKNRRPIRVLDWELNKETIPQPLGTLNKCVDSNAKTTEIIKNWHKLVINSFEKRNLDITV